MESMTPSLRLIVCLRRSLERGESLRSGLRTFVQADDSPFAKHLAHWLVERTTRQNAEVLKPQSMPSAPPQTKSPPPQRVLPPLTPAERQLMAVVERGMRGEPVAANLRELETEIVERCEAQMEAFIEILPLKALIPLMLFIFPAYLMLLLGPAVEQLLHSLR
jgi:hypothetical protein